MDWKSEMSRDRYIKYDIKKSKITKRAVLHVCAILVLLAGSTGLIVGVMFMHPTNPIIEVDIVWFSGVAALVWVISIVLSAIVGEYAQKRMNNKIERLNKKYQDADKLKELIKDDMERKGEI